jgi:hypothetical protein
VDHLGLDSLEYGDRATASELIGFVQWGRTVEGRPMRDVWWEQFLRNMIRKHAKGVFDAELAVKGARHGADFAAKEYFDRAPDWHRSADTTVRQVVAAELAAMVAQGLASGLTADTVGGYLSEDDGWKEA